MYIIETDNRSLHLLEHTISPEEDGSTVRSILRTKLGLSQRLYRRLKRENGILLNGMHVYVSAVVKQGDELRLEVEPEGEGDTIPEAMLLDIVFEDPHIILLNKPAGICVHPTHGHWTGTLANGVANYFLESGIGTRVRPVHRLDMDTSGLVLFAKHQLAHQRLAEQLEGHTLDRRYLAVASGNIFPEEGIINGGIERNPDNRKERMVSETGKSASTHYRVIEQYDGACLVQLALETGRTHQIRVHLAYIGHPLIGDPMYLTDHPVEFPRQALHAGNIRFKHPMSGEELDFSAPLPTDMFELIQGLNGRADHPW